MTTPKPPDTYACPKCDSVMVLDGDTYTCTVCGCRVMVDYIGCGLWQYSILDDGE